MTPDRETLTGRAGGGLPCGAPRLHTATHRMSAFARGFRFRFAHLSVFFSLSELQCPRDFTRCPKLRFAGPVGRKPKCKTARPSQPPPFKESRPPRGSNVRLATARHGRRRRQARRAPQERLARRAAVPHRAEEPLALARPAREAPALPPRAVPPHLALRAVRARRRHRHRSSAAPMAQGSPTRAG